MDVVRVLEQLVELSGKPTIVKSDNGSELVAKKVQEWIEDREIGIHLIEPGSPWQNGHIESFNGVFRDGCLNRGIAIWLGSRADCAEGSNRSTASATTRNRTADNARLPPPFGPDR